MEPPDAPGENDATAESEDSAGILLVSPEDAADIAVEYQEWLTEAKELSILAKYAYDQGFYPRAVNLLSSSVERQTKAVVRGFQRMFPNFVLVSEKELEEVGHNPLKAFVFIFNKPEVSSLGIALKAIPEEKYAKEVGTLEEISRDPERMLKLPPEGVKIFIKLCDDLDANLSKTLGEGLFHRTSVLFMNLYLLSALFYPHYLRSNYPADLKYKNRSQRQLYTPELGVVNQFSELLRINDRMITLGTQLKDEFPKLDAAYILNEMVTSYLRMQPNPKSQETNEDSSTQE